MVDEDKFKEIDFLLFNEDLVSAQNILNNFLDKNTAIWHYYQYKVFRKKFFTLECKSELEKAILLDIDNETYKNEHTLLLKEIKKIEKDNQTEYTKEKPKKKKFCSGEVLAEGGVECCCLCACEACCEGLGSI